MMKKSTKRIVRKNKVVFEILDKIPNGMYMYEAKSSASM